jgi:hypothetical protein
VAATYQTKATAGLTLLTPTSIAATGGSGSISTNGAVSFTSASAISLNDVFSATYDNYRIVMYQGAQGAGVSQRLKLRVGGADSSASYYTGAFLSDVSGTLNISANNETTGFIINADNCSHLSTSLDIIRPFATDRTRINGQSTHRYSSTIRGIYFGGVHDVATSYTGFTIINGGNQTGVIYVYGYNN